MPEPTKTTRRDFLKGRSAVEALGDAVIGPAPPLAPPGAARPSGGYLMHASRQAMACEWEVIWPAEAKGSVDHRGAEAPRSPADAALAALDLIDELEAQLTVYRETSEVAAINRRASREQVIIERRLFDLFQRAVELSAATGGAFDITAGPLSKVWGFFRRQGEMPAAEQVDAARQTVGSQWLELDADRQAVRFGRPGMEINLGAIGKGYATDRAAEVLQAAGLRDFVIHGGNSSVLAKGNRIADCRLRIADFKGADASSSDAQSEIPNPKSQIPNPQSEPPPGWTIGLRHPLKPDVRLAEFTLHNQALGTSGSGTQFFHYRGKRYGHVIDPRTGWPADKVLSATVIAPTAELADALSTALFVMGLEDAREFLRSRPEIGALFVSPGPQAGSIHLQSVNLPEDKWRVCNATTA